MGIAGVNNIQFKAISDVTYAVRVEKPSSVFFVSDNSMSMDQPDENGDMKIDRLQIAMKNFMSALEKADNYDEIFRSAFYGYAFILDEDTMVEPKWGTLTDAEIDSMEVYFGTNSTPALEKANSSFLMEPGYHFPVNGEQTPGKYLIFMSDGENLNNIYTPVCLGAQTPERWVYREAQFGDRLTFYHETPWVLHPVFGLLFTHYPGDCAVEFTANVNNMSLAQCTLLKNQGVQIYSIAYYVIPAQKDAAEAFMKSCSSGAEDYYFYADNGDELDAIYIKIAQKIVKEVVRIMH